MHKLNLYLCGLFILVANSFTALYGSERSLDHSYLMTGSKDPVLPNLWTDVSDSFITVNDSFITISDSFIIIRHSSTQPVYELEPIVITGSRIPTKLPDLTRSVTIITDKEIESLPVYSVPELLSYLIDARQRNIYGVQADISIRGSSFEQVLVLIDGVAVSDPQTGHHNLDIPVTLSDIERIEVLKGQGSAIYGAGALGGVINIITKKVNPHTAAKTKFPLTVGGSYGDYNTYTANIATGIQVGSFSNRLSIASQQSDGYRQDSTDFRHRLASFSSDFKDVFNLSVGWLDKDFGAYKFYGPFLSKEMTETRFATISSKLKLLKSISLEPNLYYREHYDEFILLRNNPTYYTNYHTNYKYGGELVSYFGDAVVGIEAKEEAIKSTGIRSGAKVSALGEHKRQNAAIYAEYRYRIKSLLANVGSRIDYNSLYGTYYSPSLSMGYFLGKVKFRTSFGKSFRAPTFTELYYQDPANIGDSTLKAEQSVSYEVGVDYRAFESAFQSWTQASITLFVNKQDNLIDWVKIATDSLPWTVRNIGKVTANGIEAGIEFREEKVGSFKVDYTFMQMVSELEKGYISKYALNYPEQQISVRVVRVVPYKFEVSVSGTFKVRHQEFTGAPLPTEHYTILSAELSKRIGKFSFSITGTNLLDEKYEDIAGVELPRKWLTASFVAGL